jgi:hypothetical protein
MRPGAWLAGGGATWIDDSVYSGNPVAFSERGFAGFTEGSLPLGGDDDGDGICDERDERDMIFTWVANYLTTRSNVFELDLMINVSAPPQYPGSLAGTPRQLPFQTYKVQRPFARKQVVAILDRSGCLRVRPDKTCDFSGPVDVRMLRFTDDKRTY